MRHERYTNYLLFQSTLPMKGATHTFYHCESKDGVSIHAPNEGSDRMRVILPSMYIVSIHAPNEGSDLPV